MKQHTKKCNTDCNIRHTYKFFLAIITVYLLIVANSLMDDYQITETMHMLHSQRINLTRAKDVSPNTNCTQSPKSPLAATEWSRLLHDAICSEHIPFCHC